MAILCLFLIALFTFACVKMSKYNITFDYNKQIIKVLEPGLWRATEINMQEIITIKLCEVETERKNIFPTLLLNTRLLYNDIEPTYVYNLGKKYYIKIFKKHNVVIKIPYNSLYKCKSIKTIEKFEEQTNAIIKEFNDLYYIIYVKKQKLNR